jgi:hypothetical protein
MNLLTTLIPTEQGLKIEKLVQSPKSEKVFVAFTPKGKYCIGLKTMQELEINDDNIITPGTFKISDGWIYTTKSSVGAEDFMKGL